MRIDPKFDWKTYSWIKRGPRRIKVLEELSNSKEPLTATALKRVQGIDITQAAYTVNELAGKGLAECLNPGEHLGKLFVITDKGNLILKRVRRSRG